MNCSSSRLSLGGIDPDYVQQTAKDLLRCLGDPLRRILSGPLYRATLNPAAGRLTSDENGAPHTLVAKMPGR